MAEVEPGEELTLEMKKAGIKNYVEIIPVAAGQVEHVEEDDDEPNRGEGEVAANEEPDIT